MKSNILLRTLSGIVYVAVMVGCLVGGRNTYCVLFAVITALLLNEFNHLLAEHRLARVNNTVSMVSGVYLFLAFFLYSSDMTSGTVFVPYILSLVFVLVSGLYTGQENPIATWAYSFAGQVFVALPMSLMNVLAFNGFYECTLPLALFVFLWLSDTGAFCFGCALGKKIPFKLFPSISPNKTWAGSVGGAIASMAGATCFYLLSDSGSLLFWLGFGLTVCVFGTWGDLIESQFKRQLGIKDSGNFMPGHGGILDRFDSALLAIPASVVYVSLVM
jgi:phosphatidate cytidylyltransferase